MFSQDSNLYNFKPAALGSAIINTYIAKEEIQENVRNIIKYMDVARSMEDLAIIATDVEELTPEQVALIKINANIAVAGTNKDASVYVKDNISTESLQNSSNEEIIAQSEEFVILWEKLTTQAKNILENNLSIRARLDYNTVKLQSLSKVEDATVSITVPKVLVSANTKTEESLVPGIVTDIESLQVRLKEVSVVAFNTVKDIVNSGLKEFGTKSLVVAKEELFNSDIKISNSPDGLITDVDLLGNYKVDIDDKDNVEIKKDSIKDDRFNTFSIHGSAIISLIELNSKAIELLDMCNVVVNTFINNNGSIGVEFFKNSLKNLLGSSPVLTNMVLGYCDLFAKVVTSVNTELSYCAYITRYVLAITELLDQLANINDTDKKELTNA